MKILHTADLHLGSSLGAEKRFDEHDALLKHLCGLIREEKIETVLITGDVFDTLLPPNRAAEQYYRFLHEAALAGAREIIVTGGNHDSAAYLEAPKEILKYLSVRVTATAPENCADAVVELREKDGSLAALVGVVPYLHERDLDVGDHYEGAFDREKGLRDALLEYYRRMAETLKSMDSSVPHIVTGHLFATDFGEKNDSWTGTLMSIDTAAFPESIDYLALGHLHDAHTLKTPHKTCVRYAGAPINISFRELEVPKSVTVIDTADVKNIREIPLPLFQEMRLLKGSRTEIEKGLDSLIAENRSIWVSVENTGSYEPGLSENMNAKVLNSQVKICFCRNQAVNPAVLKRIPEERHLQDLNPVDLFALLLKEREIAPDTAEELMGAFREIAAAAAEND